MKEAWNFEKCAAVLAGEIELLRKISEAQGIVRQAVINKEWAEFDEKTAEVNRIGKEFALLENERIRFFSALSDFSGRSGGGELSFYALITCLPEQENQELSRLYRELRVETIKIRALNESLLVYINEARNMATAYLEAVCPARGGKLYTRKGRRAAQDLKSMVVNNHF
ncbi:MAG: hypothetical protein FWC64_04745 [Treponema sp.]|nr:hypothetical protein [Treponema sp.]